ncbi:MAG: SDR family oxidoreductase [Candidatus Thermoplasmatota archaeon]
MPPARAALVTGASKGIGAAVAKRLAHDGFDIAVHYNTDAAGAKRTAAAIVKAGRRAVVVKGDLADPDGPKQVAEAVSEAFPRLHAIVHNAGFYDRRAFADLDEAAWRATLAVDLEAPAHLTRRLLPRLADGASLVFVSSIAAARGSTHGSAYTAAKAGLVGLTRTLARELAPRTRVNAVAPGFIDTAILAGDSPTKRKARAAEVPLGRVGSPEDVAGVVSFLCGPDSAYVTGTVLHVNGGLWIG